MNIRAWLASVVERAGLTFVQSFVAFYVLGEVGELSWSSARMATAAGVAAVVSMALAATNAAVIPTGLPFGLDVALRVARTAAATALGYVAIQPDVFDAGAWKGAVAAAGAGFLTALKAALAHHVGDGATAALLPERLDAGSSSWILPPLP